jgi:hypothetical protein
MEFFIKKILGIDYAINPTVWKNRYGLLVFETVAQRVVRIRHHERGVICMIDIPMSKVVELANSDSVELVEILMNKGASIHDILPPVTHPMNKPKKKWHHFITKYFK